MPQFHTQKSTKNTQIYKIIDFNKMSVSVLETKVSGRGTGIYDSEHPSGLKQHQPRILTKFSGHNPEQIQIIISTLDSNPEPCFCKNN